MASSQMVTEALALIAAGETPAALECETLDFKEPSSDKKKTLQILIEAALCFANAEGGTVVVGVRDKTGGEAAFVGTELTPEQVKRQIFDSTKPSLLVDVSEVRAPADVETSSKTLLAIRVPQSPEIHSDSKGRAPRRVGRDCIPMDPVQQRMLREERKGIDWTA